ncbi:MAG: VOC family protein [Alphaproteobacteria bacterium]|nr:VOC family protein [Alphaproteobacteria bacterium]
MTTNYCGLPGLQGGDHVGLTVPDLEQAVEFFAQVIGCIYVFDGGRFGEDPEFMSSRLNVHPNSSLRYCFMRCRNGLNLELFEYEAPDQNAAPPRNSDIGGHHLAFYVDDIDAAVDHLLSHGVKVLGDPIHIKEGPAAGGAWVYFMSPWGLQLELVSYPNGKAYEETADLLLWHPKYPTR